jgi:hypothetical protein
MLDSCQMSTFAAILRTHGTFIVRGLCPADTLKLSVLNNNFSQYCIYFRNPHFC